MCQGAEPTILLGEKGEEIEKNSDTHNSKVVTRGKSGCEKV